MKGPHIHGQAVPMTAEEREQARLIAGFTYFENGRAKFPEAYRELIYSIAVTAYHKPEAFKDFILNASQDENVTAASYLALAEQLQSCADALRISWKDAVAQG